MTDEEVARLRAVAEDASSTAIDAELMTPTRETVDLVDGPLTTRHLAYLDPTAHPVHLEVVQTVAGTEPRFAVTWYGGEGHYSDVVLWRPAGPQPAVQPTPDGVVRFTDLERGPARIVATLTETHTAVQTEWFLLID